MPVYNAERYVADAMRSVLQQSFVDYELIVIDDGSTDGSWEVISEIDDRRIRRLRHAANQGISATMNAGLECAQGRYVAVMDADDVCRQGRFARQIGFLERHPGIVACGMDVMACSTERECQRWRYPRSPEEVQIALVFNNPVAHPTLMMRADFLREQGLRYDGRLRRAQDYSLIEQIASRGRIANIGRTGCVYRLHDVNKTPDWAVESRRTAARIRKHILGRLGLPETDDQAKLHEYVATVGASGGHRTLHEVVQWLDRLSSENRRRKIWPVPVMNSLLCDQLNLLSTRLGWPARDVVREIHRAAFLGDGVSRKLHLLGFWSRLAKRGVLKSLRCLQTHGLQV